MKSARHKLNVMGYVTECWSLKDDCCINFDLKRSDSSTLLLIGVQSILHTYRLRVRALLCTRTHGCVCFSYQTHSTHTHAPRHITLGTLQANRLHSFQSSRPTHHHHFTFRLVISSDKTSRFSYVCWLANYNYQYNYLVPLCCAP